MAQPHLLYMGGSPPLAPPPSYPNVNFSSRVYAKDQPPNLQATFTEFYPNGLPNVYKMLQTPGLEGVAQTYVEDNLPVGFYTKPRSTARAIFSTLNGQRPFRPMQHLLPRRRIHLWNRDEIQSVCNSIRKKFWDHMKGMQQPYCWDSLWTYFDAFDLYHYGALNLWNVVNHLFDENKIIYMDLTKELAVHIGRWADEWLIDEENRNKLLEWDDTQGPLLPLLSEADWREIGNIQDDTLPHIANALKHRRALILSPEGSQQNAKPNDLMSACMNNNIENWLAGQKVFTPTGLPSPPEAKSHRCSPASEKAPEPVVMYNGNHYYFPRSSRVPSAVEALQRSAAAAGGNPENPQQAGQVVAHGTNKPTAPKPRNPGSNGASSQAVQGLPESRSKSTEPIRHYTLPRPAKSHEEPNHPVEAVTSPNPSDDNVDPEDADDDYERVDALTPTKVRRRGVNNPRSAKGAPKATVTASLPASAVMGFSELATTSEPASDNLKPSGQPVRRSSEPLAENQANTEPLTGNGKETSKEHAFDRNVGVQAAPASADTSYPANGQSLNHPQRSYSGSQTASVSNGDTEHQKRSRITHSQPSQGFQFHPPGSLDQVPQPEHSAFQHNMGVPTGPTGMDFRQPAQQKGPASQRGRNNGMSSRFDRHHYEPSEGQWSHQYRTEGFGTHPDPATRGGHQRGASRRGNRRGSNNQRNVTAPAIQHQADLGLPQKRRDGASWNNSSWRRPASGLTQVTCRNAASLHGLNDYVPCSCEMCNTRNRSVHVRVKGPRGQSAIDLQARIKHGLSDRFGIVDEVFPVNSKDQGTVMARFRDEQSVAEALAIGGVDMPERGISVTVSPAMRSKWVSLPTSGQHDRRNNTREPTIGPVAQPASAMAYATQTAANVPMAMAHPAALGISHVLPGAMHPAATGMPVMPRGYAAPNYFHHGAQLGTSNFVRPVFNGHPLAAKQSTIDPQHYIHQEQRTLSAPFDASSLEAPPIANPEENKISSDETLQSKPPAEEELDEIQHAEQDGLTTPRSDGSKGSGVKARVSLPCSPPKASAVSQDHGDAKEIPETLMDESAKHEKRGNQDGPAIGVRLGTLTGDENTPPTKAPPAQPDTFKVQTSHSRVPSVFTEDEIKERCEAWSKISMPLNPRKPKLTSPIKTSSTDTKDAGLHAPKSDKFETGTSGSDKSSPTRAVIFTPESGSVYEPSPKTVTDKATLQQGQRDRSATPSDQGEGNGAIASEAQWPDVSAETGCQHDTQSFETNATDHCATGQISGQLSNPREQNRAAAGRGVRQVDESPQDSELSTPTTVNITKFLPRGGESSTQTSEWGSKPEKQADFQHKGKPKKAKKKKKAKQNGDANGGTAVVPTASQTHLSFGPQHQPADEPPTSRFMGSRHEQLKPMMDACTEHVTHSEGQASGSPSPTQRHQEGQHQPTNFGTMKRTKRQNTPKELAPNSQTSTRQAHDESDSPEEDSRGRKGFRMGRGGSLRIGKQRRARPLITDPALVEGGQTSPSSSGFVPEYPAPPGAGGSQSKNGGEKGPAAKSRLNPKAQEFVSPSRPASLDEPGPDKSSTSTDRKGKARGDSSDRQHNNEATTVKPRETHNHSRHNSLREGLALAQIKETFSKPQRAISEATKKSTHNTEGVSHEGRKASTKGNKRGKGKERSATVGEKIEEKPEPKQEKAQDDPHTPDRKSDKEKKPGLINDDWPSLPGPRDRALSKPQTPSVWSAKKKATSDERGAEQHSPLKNE